MEQITCLVVPRARELRESPHNSLRGPQLKNSLMAVLYVHTWWKKNSPWLLPFFLTCWSKQMGRTLSFARMLLHPYKQNMIPGLRFWRVDEDRLYFPCLDPSSTAAAVLCMAHHLTSAFSALGSRQSEGLLMVCFDWRLILGTTGSCDWGRLQSAPSSLFLFFFFLFFKAHL